jgi:hypothetical protein
LRNLRLYFNELSNGHFVVGSTTRDFVEHEQLAGFATRAAAVNHAVKLVRDAFKKADPKPTKVKS